MSKLSIIKIYPNSYGFKNYALNRPCEEILPNEFNSKELHNFIQDMFETLYDYPSGVGLAANQVGVLSKICIIDLKRDGKKPYVCINPTYTPISEEKVMSREQCISFPNISVTTKRYNKIKVFYQDFFGKKHEIVVEGFKAFVFQHEIEHLNGNVFIDSININEDLSVYEGYSSKLAKVAMEAILNEN